MNDDPLDDFERRATGIDGAERAVYVGGEGPAVIVMAEMPGISPDRQPMLSDSSTLLRGRGQQAHHFEPCLLLHLADLPEDAREHVALMSGQPLLQRVPRRRQPEALASSVGRVDGLRDQPSFGEFAEWGVHRLLRDPEGTEQLTDAEVRSLRDGVEDAMVNAREPLLGKERVGDSGDRPEREVERFEGAIEVALAGAGSVR